MTQYDEFFIRRTDGVAVTTNEINGGAVVANPEKPHVSEPVAGTHKSMRDWCIKLGSTIKFNLGSDVSDSKSTFTSPHGRGPQASTQSGPLTCF